MESLLTPQNITFLVGVLGVIFTVYNSFRNPQIKTDQENIKLNDRLTNVEKSVTEIRENHLAALEKDLKELNKTINNLSITVTQLSTIIDERIPRNI